MTEYITTILNDPAFRLVIITFVGLFISVFFVGYFIRLVISLLYIICGNIRGKG